MTKGFGEAVRLWMEENVGTKFKGRDDMAIRCGNAIGCSSVTSDRWIVQLATRNGPFRIVSDEEGDWMIKRKT